MSALDNLDRVTIAQVEHLRHAIAVAGLTGAVPVSLVPDDTPYIQLRNGLQLCAETSGRFDLWRNEFDIVRAGLTLNEAVALLTDQTP